MSRENVDPSEDTGTAVDPSEDPGLESNVDPSEGNVDPSEGDVDPSEGPGPGGLRGSAQQSASAGPPPEAGKGINPVQHSE